MVRRLEKLLQVQPGEWRKLLLLGSYIGVVVGNFMLLQSFNDANFLAVYPISYLPYLFIASAIVMSIVSTLFGALAERVSERQLSVATPVASGAAILCFSLLAELEIPGFTFVFYILIFVINSLVVIVGWNLVRNAFDTRQVKRLMPVIGGLSSIGAALGGLLARQLSSSLGTGSLPWASAGLFAVVFFLTLADDPESGGGEEGIERRRSKGKPPSLVRTTREGFGLIFRNRLMLLMTVMLACSVVAKTLIDYQFKTSLKLRFDKDEIAAFLGSFYAVSNAVEFLGQMLLSGRLMSRFGLTAALVSRPLAIALLAVAAVINPMFWTFVATRFADAVSNRVWYKPGTNQVYAPIVARRANRIKMTQEGTIEPLVIIATSGVLLIVSQAVDLAQLGWLIIAATICWFLAALRTHRHYVAELAQAIENRLLDLDHVAEEGHLIDDATLRRLQGLLDDDDPRDRSLCLEAGRKKQCRLPGETGRESSRPP